MCVDNKIYLNNRAVKINDPANAIVEKIKNICCDNSKNYMEMYIATFGAGV